MALTSRAGRSCAEPTTGAPGAPSPPAGTAGPHYGWVVVGVAFTVLFLTYGVQYAFGLFFTALTAEFGWSRASLSSVFALYAATYSFFGLVSGRLTDRWGPRRVVALGGLLLGSGLALSGLVDALDPLFLTYFVAGLGMSTAYVPCTSTVVRWFTARRGLAVGLTLSGAGVGIFACPPLVAVLLERLGWRATYVVLGLGLLLALVGLSRLLAREPAARGLLPYGGLEPEPTGNAAASDSWPLRRALRHRSFVALGAVYAATWIPVFLPLVHLAPLAQDLGLPPVAAATALSAVGVGSLAGRFAMGALSDLIGRRATLAIALALQAGSFLSLALASHAPALFSAAAVFGFAYGAITALMPAIVTDFFGPRHAGTLVGVVFGVAGPTSALGPIIGGWAFDATGSYAGAFGAAAGLNVLALVLLGLARRPA